jgi:putative transposase
MSTTSNPYRGFRFPAEIINQAVWLYRCLSLSLREVELILASRGYCQLNAEAPKLSLRTL